MKKTIAFTFCLVAALAIVRSVNGRQNGDQVNSSPQSSVLARQASQGFSIKNATGYDPLDISDEEIQTLELSVKDLERNREFPVLVYLPATTQPTAVIVHSHGLGGTRNTSPFLGKHWAARGYVAVFVQHPGSDDSIWVDVPRWQRMRELKKAANGENLTLRTGDVTALIDQLKKWNTKGSHQLKGRMDLNHIGMSGHSFGALTTQHVGGQKSFGTPRYLDDRIKAAIPMSPSSPRAGSVEKAFGDIRIPWLCMTGTHDSSLIGGANVESRLAVYPALSPGDKYELVLDKAEHSVFTESKLVGDQQAQNPNHHLAIKAITTAFWDSYLRKDIPAKNWLKTESVRTVLEEPDRWQLK